MPTQPLSPADSRSFLGFGRQATKGTAVAPTHFATYIGQLGFAHNANLRDIREAGGGLVPARQVKDFIAPSVEYGMPIRPDQAGAALAMFLGSDTIAGAGPYTHTLVPVDGRELVTFERNIADDVVERIIDGVFTGATIEYAKRDSTPELMIALTADGITEEDQAAPVVESYETDRPFLRSDTTWAVDTAEALTPTNIESVTIDIQKEFDATVLADALTRSDIVPLRLGITVEMVQLFESSDEADAYRLTHYYDGTQTPALVPGELTYPGDLQVISTYGTGAGLRTLDVDLPTINWGEAELTENDPEASEAIRLTRRGIVVAGAGAPITIVMTNNFATGYLA